MCTTIETSSLVIRSRRGRGCRGALRFAAVPEVTRLFGFGERSIPAALVQALGTRKITSRLGPGTVVDASSAVIECAVRALRAAPRDSP